MISFSILTVYAFLRGLSYFNINYAIILLLQLMFFEDAIHSNIGRQLHSNFFETHKCKMEMNRYMIITEHCKNLTKSF